MRAPPEYGSDVIADLFARGGIEFAALNPGASFRGIHDSIVNRLSNRGPQLITCCHEQIAVGIAHGYAVASGQPMLALLHDVVGLQQACVAIYSAWVDRAPVIVVGGTGPLDAARRRPWIDWLHTANVQANLVRDFTKWDDQPSSLAAVPRSFARALNIAMSEPKGPVYLCYDATLQEQDAGDIADWQMDIRQYPMPSRLQADDEALELLADRLVNAETPLILTEFAGRYDGAVQALADLADLLGSAVMVVSPGRYNAPSNHPLVFTRRNDDVIGEADVILAVDVMDLFGYFHTGEDRLPVPAPKSDRWLAHMRLGDVAVKAWSQDFQELVPLDQEVRCDPGVALPRLVELVRGRVSVGSRAKTIQSRRTRLEQASSRDRDESFARVQASGGTPISRSYLSWAIRLAVEHRDYVVAKDLLRGSLYHFLDIDRPAKWVGMNAGGGLGNGLGYAIGACLGRRGHEVYVAVVGDGDFLYTPNALWTAASLQLPIVFVVANNRSYLNDENHQRRVAELRGRPVSNAGVGTRLDSPPVDIAALATSLGVRGFGPVTDAGDLVAVLKTAVDHASGGTGPALVDILTA